MRNFLINYDESVSKCSFELFVTFLKSHRDIESWSVPFRGLFLVKSKLELNPLMKAVEEIVGRHNYFVAELSPEDCGGRLPSEIWDWFNKSILPDELVKQVRELREERSRLEG